MNDERGLFGKGGIGEEAVGFSDLNEGLELGISKLRSDYAKMGVEDKVDEFKKKSRSRPLEMKAGFDGDDEPIGSFFKLKKRPRNGAKSVKSGDNGRIKVAKSVNSSNNGGIRVGVEKPRVKEEDSGEMEDTLASFKKKLKAPKRVKGGGSGVVKEKDEVGPSDRSYIGSLKDGAGQAGAILDEGLEDSMQKLVRKPRRASDEVGGRKHSDEAGASDQSLIGSLKDGAGQGGLKDFVQKRGRKSRCALMRKKNGDASGIQESQSTSLEEQKKGDVGFGESVDHSSDDNLELSLSEFVRKSYSCSVRKARSTSIQKRTNDGISTDLAPMLGQRLHSASPSKWTKEMVKSEGKFILASDVISKRKSCRASVAKLQEGNAKFDEQLDQDFNENSEESLPAGVGKTYSDIVPKDTVENQRSDDGSSRNSNLIKKDSFGCPVQEDCSYTFPDITEVTVKLTEEVHKCEDGLKQCFNEKSSDSLYGITKISNFVSDLKHTEETSGFDDNRLNKHANEISVDLSSSLVIMSSPAVPAHAEEHPESKNVSNKLSDGTCIQVQNPCSVNAVKITEDTIRSDDGLNRSSDGDPEVQISSAILKSCSASFLVPRKEIPSSCFNDYPFNGPCEEIDKESAPDCDDCLNKLPLHVEKLCSAYNKNEAEEGTGYDELAEPVGGNLKCSLSSLVRNSPLNSMTMKTGDIHLPDDGLNKYSDGFLKDFQFVQLQTSSSASGTMKKEETNSCSDGLSQTLDVAIEDSLIVTEKKPHLAPVDMQMEQTGITGDELKRFSDTTLSVSPSVDDEKSDFATPLCPKEELASIGDVFNHFSCGLVVDSTTVSQKRDSANLQTPSTVDASKEPSSAPIEDTFVEEAKTSCCQSIMQDVNEFYLEDVRKASDAEIKEKTLLTMQREVRKIKKPRHGDMAYEGDIDWEVLMQQQGFFENNPATDEDWSIRTKDKSDSPSNMLAEADDGGAAAVAAGLKAHAVGPVEKIKFKEFLKRRGGLQEYLECRNLILALWNKDVSRILPLIDCGVTEAPLENESPRSSIIREIYAFLDHSGYINVGIASEKQVARPCGMSHLKLSKENLLVDSFGGRVPDSEDEDAFILAKVKNSDNLIAAKNNGSFGDGVLASTVVKEDVRSKKLSVSNTHTEFSIMGVSAECAVGNMDIDTQLSRVACVPGCLGGEKAVPINKNSGLKVPLGSESCTYVPSDQEDGCRDAQVPNGITKWDNLNDDPSCGVVDSRPDTVFALEQSKVADSKLRSIDIGKERAVHAKITGIQSTAIDPSEVSNGTQYDSEVGKRIIVIGAGPAGLTAARHLQRQGFSVMILEARNRIGGRVYTDRVSLSVPVDLGASIITGVEADMTTERRPDPSSLLCAQLGLELTVLNSECPLYDTVTGEKVPSDLDEALEAEYNSLLDDMVVFMDQNCEVAMRMSLEDGLAYALTKRRMARSMVTALESDEPKVSDSEVLHMSMNASVDTKMTNGDDNRVLGDGSSLENILSPLERRVMNWHFANLEYGCAALLKEVSLPYWNQDDVYGGFGGAHCMIKGGYSTVLESLGKGLHIHLNHVVTEVTYGMDSAGTHGQQSLVNVHTSSGSVFVGDAVLITVPLGCLKANAIKFSPVLPEWKQSSIQRLGFGVLNKVVLEFPEVFWDDTVDYFGATAEETGCRGQCFMFWNVKKTAGAPVLIALVVGKAAIDGQYMSTSEHVNHALMVLRKIFGEASVPDPIASVVTNWGRDPFSRGAYSYVAVGASGEDYDILGRPVENCLFFAGEATCKEHPDTVGGAMMSGLREAVRIIDILSTGNDYTAEVEAMEAAQRQSDSERNEVRDLVKRLDAIELSNNLCKSSLNGVKRLTEEALLRDMFFNATTAAGRLHLAKKLLHLPVEVLKSFAGTKEGLSTLNSWIRDSMGKDGTQLLRHCVRLLVLVSTDLLAVRLSGIGKTVKERVCVHTSRDIRAVASQLVNMWIEVFRKEKAANGGLKVPRQTTVADSSKVKSKVLSSGKPPLRNETSDVRGTMQVPSSAGSYSPSGATNKKVLCTPVKLEALNNSKSGFNSSNSHNVIQSMDSTVDGSIAMSEEEAAAFAAAEAARNAALAAAEAYASSEADCNTLRELPKIPSFHKFARREQYTQMDDSDLRRRKWSGGVLGRQDCISEIDSRNCRVRNWSVDFPSACGNLDSSRMSGDNYTQRSNSNDIACHLNLREHSGESGAVDSSILTRAWVDSPGSWGIKDYHAIERWQSQAEAADPDFLDPTIHVRDEEESNKVSKLLVGMYGGQAEESSASQATENRGLTENHKRGAEHIKQAVVDYVTSLLMPLYKARKIDKEGYKSIMRKSATKVMDLSTEAEKVMSVTEFLDFKRRNKIRAFVDKLIERQMEINPNIKS